MKTLTLIATGSLLALGAAAQATTIANWTFETSVPTTSGPHAAEVGAGLASSSHVLTGAVFSNPAGNGSAESFSSNFWSTNDYYEFTFSLTGFENATFGWDQTASGTGPQSFDLAVSTDGTTFTTLSDNYVVGTNSWSSGTNQPLSTFAPISLGASTDNASQVWVRLISQVTTATGGTNRVDNIIVDATDAVPEPATMAILGLGLAALAKRKRK